jgi:hypothetical protein
VRLQANPLCRQNGQWGERINWEKREQWRVCSVTQALRRMWYQHALHRDLEVIDFTMGRGGGPCLHTCAIHSLRAETAISLDMVIAAGKATS